MEDLLKRGKDLVDKEIECIEAPYINFDGIETTGHIEVHKSVSDEVIQIFKDIKDIGFPIYNIETIDNYDYDDEKSVIANNTSGYNFRFVANSTKLSDHSIGLAIDINPVQNPWVHPSALNLFPYKPGTKGTIESNSEIVDIFKKYGWSWGGDWRNPDYQHFFKSDNKIKSDIYNSLKIGENRISKFKDFRKS